MAHGITLSGEQLAHARDRVRAAGMEGRVELELRDWRELDGRWDKIASIEMCEHVGVERLPAYFERLRGCLRDGGSLLLQATARRAKKLRSQPSRDTRLLQQYLLPGIEVIEIGRTAHMMERAGLEIHEIEGLRQHYALTARAWSRNLFERREEAVRLVGEESYRLWLLLLTGLALTYGDGSNQVFQLLASPYRKRLGPARTPSAGG
jgi:cyclopropane-fatty-acyl-phospholipid synthase